MNALQEKHKYQIYELEKEVVFWRRVALLCEDTHSPSIEELDLIDEINILENVDEDGVPTYI